MIYAEQACAIAEKIKIPKKAEAYYYIARCLIFIGKYKESKIFLDKGMDEKFVKKYAVNNIVQTIKINLLLQNVYFA